MQLNYKDYFALVVINRLGRLFNQTNRAIQACNHATERQLGLNPGILTQHTRCQHHLRDNVKQYEATLKFIEKGLMALQEYEQAERVALMKEENLAGQSYVAFCQHPDGSKAGRAVPVDPQQFFLHANAACQAYRSRNAAHVCPDILDQTMDEQQQAAYRKTVHQKMTTSLCGMANAEYGHLKALSDAARATLVI